MYRASGGYIGLTLGLFGLLPLSGSGHHAFSGVFDMDDLTELEGEITRLLWRNPHVRFTMRTADGESWDIETNSVSILSRMDVGADLLSEGDRVAVAGYPRQERRQRNVDQQPAAVRRAGGGDAARGRPALDGRTSGPVGDLAGGMAMRARRRRESSGSGARVSTVRDGTCGWTSTR